MEVLSMLKCIASIFFIVLIFFLLTLYMIKIDANYPAAKKQLKEKNIFLMDAMMWGH
jgi:hypothetical protein